jgi:hypothetical protein
MHVYVHILYFMRHMNVGLTVKVTGIIAKEKGTRMRHLHFQGAWEVYYPETQTKLLVQLLKEKLSVVRGDSTVIQVYKTTTSSPSLYVS